MPSQSSPKGRKIRTFDHVRSLLACTARNLESGKITPAVATAMSAVAGKMLEAIKLRQDEECELLISQLREVLAAQKTPTAQVALATLQDTLPQ